MRRQYIFVTIWLIFYALEVFSADIAWACQRAPEDKIIWSCVADRSQSVEPKAVFKDPAVSLEEPLSATDLERQVKITHLHLNHQQEVSPYQYGWTISLAESPYSIWCFSEFS